MNYQALWNVWVFYLENLPGWRIRDKKSAVSFARLTGPDVLEEGETLSSKSPDKKLCYIIYFEGLAPRAFFCGAIDACTRRRLVGRRQI
jgi:hypothetical protein